MEGRRNGRSWVLAVGAFVLHMRACEITDSQVRVRGEDGGGG